VSTSKKSDTAVRLSEEDQEQILNLTRDVQRTWSAVEESHRKENSTREALTLIKAEIEDLRASVERGAYSSVAAEKKLRDMTAMRDEIGRETDEVRGNDTGGWKGLGRPLQHPCMVHRRRRLATHQLAKCGPGDWRLLMINGFGHSVVRTSVLVSASEACG